ncbi:hemerythrin domain-containing protein [Kitasatospora phosalacinea]|uniref:Hemerythrin domain-containing protein n=1 Tax=Kitasatospora phosalacinea TaxID=2065 RepID=A0ABW6GUY0_9ACTN
MPRHLLPVGPATTPAQRGNGTAARQGGAPAAAPVPAREPAPVVEPVPFAGLTLLHAAVRRDLARIPQALRLLQPDDAETAGALKRHWDFVTAMVTCHHEQQDTRLWPVLRRFAPELRLLLNWLESDHHNLDQCFTRTTTLVGIATRDPASAWSVSYAVEELAARVETHLRIEERQLLPRMAGVFQPGSRIGTLPELLDLLRYADGPSASDALVWLLEGVDPAQVDRLLADCDDETVRHWPHWRDTYARCTDRLWGPPGQ